MKLKHILVTTDLSAESLRPLQPIATLAKDTGAKLTLLNVVEDLQIAPHGAPLAPPISSPELGKDIQHAKNQLEEQRAAIGSDVDVHTEVISATDIAAAVVEYAATHDVDLIAISTHGRKGFRRFALGSVAERVLRESAVPVLSFQRPKE